MADFVAYYSRWRVVMLLLGCIAFVALGLWMAGIFGPPPHSSTHPDGEIFVFGWLGVLFFGLCGVAGVRNLFDSREQLSIGPSGVRYSQWSEDTIPWSEITDVTIWRYKRQKTIVLHLRDRARYPATSPPISHNTLKHDSSSSRPRTTECAMPASA